jgi:hypothetical protein
MPASTRSPNRLIAKDAGGVGSKQQKVAKVFDLSFTYLEETMGKISFRKSHSILTSVFYALTIVVGFFYIKAPFQHLRKRLSMIGPKCRRQNLPN